MHRHPICLRLLMHCVRAAASRTFCTAGTIKAIRIAMMAMTTSNSMSVNAFLGMNISPGRPGFMGATAMPMRKTSESACNSTLGGYDVTRGWQYNWRRQKVTSSQAHQGNAECARERGENA